MSENKPYASGLSLTQQDFEAIKTVFQTQSVKQPDDSYEIYFIPIKENLFDGNGTFNEEIWHAGAGALQKEFPLERRLTESNEEIYVASADNPQNFIKAVEICKVLLNDEISTYQSSIAQPNEGAVAAELQTNQENVLSDEIVYGNNQAKSKWMTDLNQYFIVQRLVLADGNEGYFLQERKPFPDPSCFKAQALAKAIITPSVYKANGASYLYTQIPEELPRFYKIMADLECYQQSYHQNSQAYAAGVTHKAVLHKGNVKPTSGAFGGTGLTIAQILAAKNAGHQNS